MSQLSNINDAITTLTRSVDALVALPPSGIDSVAVQAAADAVNLQVNRVDTFVAARTTTTPPPAASGLSQATHG